MLGKSLLTVQACQKKKKSAAYTVGIISVDVSLGI